MRFWLLTLVMIFVGATQTQAQAMGHGHGKTIYFVYNNNTFTYHIGDEDFRDTPAWDPENGEPPISLGDALVAARRTLSRFVTDWQRFEIEYINLERFEPHKWVYGMSFHCWDQRCSDTNVSFTVFVKMDGSVIEPEVTPKAPDSRDTNPINRLDASRGSVLRMKLFVDYS